MNSATWKNMAVTGLCIVTAIVLVMGYRRLDKALALVEARSDALYTLAVSAEQRNRAAIDDSARVGGEINELVASVRTQIVPRAAGLLTTVERTSATLASQTQTVGESVDKLVQSTTTSVDQLTTASVLGLTQLNEQVGTNGQALAQTLASVQSRVDSPQLDQVLDSSAQTALHLASTSQSLAKAVETLDGVSKDLKATTVHAPAIAESVDKIFQHQRKWSGAMTLLRILSILR